MAWWSPRARSSWVGPTAPARSPQRLTVRESRARLQPKVAHRAEPDVVVLDRGGHDVAVAGPGGDVAETLRPPGRPVHRTIRDPRGATPRGRRTRPGSSGRPAGRCKSFTSRCGRPRSSSAVPRSRSSRAGSPTGGASGACVSSSRRAAWRSSTPSSCGTTTRSRPESAMGGWCATSASRTCCRSCPDPLDGAPRGERPGRTEPDELRREQAELEFDAMQLLGRTERWLIVQRERTRERNEASVAARQARGERLRALRRRLASSAQEVAGPAPDRAQPPVEPVAARGGAGSRALACLRAVRLAMTLKVRDEADIIEDNLRYHRAQGVDFFVVADTGSTDGTVEILEPYERAGIVRLERIGRGIHDMKEGGEAEITRIAGEMGADWVIHNDADEFWWPLTGDLKEALAAIPDRYGHIVRAADRVRGATRRGPVRGAAHHPRGPVPATAEIGPPSASAGRDARPPPSRDLGRPERLAIRRTGRKAGPANRGRALRDGRARAADRANLSRSRPPLPVPLLRAVQAPRRDRARERSARPQRRGPPGSRRLRGRAPRGDLPAPDARRRRRGDGESTRAGWSRTPTSATTSRPARTRSSGGEAPPGARAWPDERRQRELAGLEHDAMYAISRYLQTQRATGPRRDAARAPAAPAPSAGCSGRFAQLRRPLGATGAPAEDRIEPLVAPSSPRCRAPSPGSRSGARTPPSAR